MIYALFFQRSLILKRSSTYASVYFSVNVTRASVGFFVCFSFNSNGERKRVTIIALHKSSNAADCQELKFLHGSALLPSVEDGLPLAC